MTIYEEMPSVKTAVELEARRRKRVFLMFLALLAIPVAIGAYAVAKAPSDAQIMAARVSPIVEENIVQSVDRRIDQKIEPRVDEIVAQRATPVIERTLDRAVTARVQPLERSYRALAIQDETEHAKAEERVRELEARVAALERRLAVLTDPRRPRPLEGVTERPPVTYVPKRP